MRRFIVTVITIALAFSGCTHYPSESSGGGDVDPDGGTPGGGSCGNASCPTDGQSDADMNGGGGSDGGSCSDSDGGTCGACPEGKTCVDGSCVCDGDGDDGKDRTCHAGKTLLCHYPSGHPSDRHDICVGDPAVPAHQAHGDTLGDCP